MNYFDQLRDALANARAVKLAVEHNGNAMLDLLDGNLRGLSPYRLKKIKNQLRKFNIHTSTWSDE